MTRSHVLANLINSICYIYYMGVNHVDFTHVLAIFFVLLAFVVSGCLMQTPDKHANSHSNLNITKLVSACVSKCEAVKSSGQDLSNGPCLSNDIAPGWVCDVAHWPRQPVDNLPENQCPAYGKTAHAFVEVDTNCKPIRTWDGHKMIMYK